MRLNLQFFGGRGASQSKPSRVSVITEEMEEAIRYFTLDGHTAIRHGEAEKERIAIENFIEISPAYEGEIYRGINLEGRRAREFEAQLQEGAIIEMGGISSWTSDYNVASEFSRSGHLSHKILFTVENNKTGVDISDLSANWAEKEVIMSGKAKYKVKKVQIEDNSTEWFGVSKNITVVLEEV